MTIKTATISYITLGVADLKKMQSFYSDLGFHVYAESDAAEQPYIMYKSGSLILALYPKHLLAKQAGISIEDINQNNSMSISLNVDSKNSVDKFINKAKQLNAIITRSTFEPTWGGYCGYFKDPENNLWEIVWHQKYQFPTEFC